MSPTRARAVRFDEYGDRAVLHVTEVPIPRPAAGEVLVEVRAAGINPGEAAIRSGAMHAMFPATFPSGQGSDLAGVVTELGEGVGDFGLGDEVLGFSWQRSSQATHVVVPVSQLILKPQALSWEVAGALYVVGCTAWAAVEAVAPKPGETVAVSAAAGGVGTVVVQLLAVRGAHVLGIASPANVDWLTEHGATPVPYGDDLAGALTAAAPDGIDAFIDLFGPDYVQLAVDLGISRDRIETIISFQKAQELGTKSAGSDGASTREVLTEMADLVASGRIEIPIAATYPLDDVRDAFAELEKRHTRGKIVLIP
ncbi:NADP-dependent oxidoreductase [Streptomyces sp. MBT65]|uniref:NADP-dependent oxidoreductase n=1 Tax=Streptomyces sp. MBT65 TaxID=1488395 RepID=UPI00190CE834|nr:NADP-dependent oxidoreductase [Streptomyces sp. MBT65]MBK3580213.1 NADP-dependent oxidoreductase [Streptomyces sp. MBT65]